MNQQAGLKSAVSSAGGGLIAEMARISEMARNRHAKP
jgi:hypothetical protein